MTESFTAADGRRIAYADSGGGGPAVLCLAGLTRNMADFADLAERMAPRYRVIRTDYRGRGASDWAEDPLAEYTVPVELGDAVALLDRLGVERATILGTSRGGLIGMAMAAGIPARVSGLILNDVGPVIEPAGLAAIADYVGVPLRYESFAAAAGELQSIMGAAFPGLPPGRWLAFARTIYRDEGGKPALDYDPRLREAVLAALEAPPPELWDLFDAVGVPLLTIRGENSDILSPETLSEMARRRPDMAEVTVRDRGHVPFLDEPEALAAIEAFLETHAR